MSHISDRQKEKRRYEKERQKARRKGIRQPESANALKTLSTSGLFARLLGRYRFKSTRHKEFQPPAKTLDHGLKAGIGDKNREGCYGMPVRGFVKQALEGSANIRIEIKQVGKILNELTEAMWKSKDLGDKQGKYFYKSLLGVCPECKVLSSYDKLGTLQLANSMGASRIGFSYGSSGVLGRFASGICFNKPCECREIVLAWNPIVNFQFMSWLRSLGAIHFAPEELKYFEAMGLDIASPDGETRVQGESFGEFLEEPVELPRSGPLHSPDSSLSVSKVPSQRPALGTSMATCPSCGHETSENITLGCEWCSWCGTEVRRPKRSNSLQSSGSPQSTSKISSQEHRSTGSAPMCPSCGHETSKNIMLGCEWCSWCGKEVRGAKRSISIPSHETSKSSSDDAKSADKIQATNKETTRSDKQNVVGICPKCGILIKGVSINECYICGSRLIHSKD